MNSEELRAEFARLPDVGTGLPYTWERHRQSFRRHVREDDPEKFLRWSTSVATMFVGNAPYVKHELDTFGNKWKKAAEEVWFGDPVPYKYARWTSGNFIHMAYHLRMFERLSWYLVENLGSVYEFGGGYGAMAVVARQAGFGGEYVIQDLPELSLLQRYYLSNVGVEAELVVDLPESRDFDLFVACFSLSEVDVDTREYILDNVSATTYLFAFQHVWEGLNNTEWFMEFVDRKKMNHELREMDHMESGPNYHLVMWR